MAAAAEAILAAASKMASDAAAPEAEQHGSKGSVRRKRGGEVGRTGAEEAEEEEAGRAETGRAEAGRAEAGRAEAGRVDAGRVTEAAGWAEEELREFSSAKFPPIMCWS